MEAAERFFQLAAGWLVLVVEVTGAVIVAVGVALALGLIGRAVLVRRPTSFNAIRLVLARYLALALEFQLAADILSTAIAPSWDQIGRLAVIAVVRTFLNFFLEREIKEEQEAERAEREVRERAGLDAVGPSPLGAPAARG